MSRPLARWIRGAFSSRATCMASAQILGASRAIQLFAFYHGLSSAGVRLLRAPCLTPARLGACRYTAVQHWADAGPAGPTVYPVAVPGTPHVHTTMCPGNVRPLANAVARRTRVSLADARELVRADAASAFAHHFAGEARGRRDGAGSDCGVPGNFSCEELDVFPCDLRLSLDPHGEEQMVADHEHAPLVPIKYSGGPGNVNAPYKNFRLTDIERSVHEGCVLPVHEHARARVQDAKAKARGEPVPSSAVKRAPRATPTRRPAGAPHDTSNGAKRRNNRLGEGYPSACASSYGAGHDFGGAAVDGDAGAHSVFRELVGGPRDSFGLGGGFGGGFGLGGGFGGGFGLGGGFGGGFGGAADLLCEWPLGPVDDFVDDLTGIPPDAGTGERGRGGSPNSIVADSALCAADQLL